MPDNEFGPSRDGFDAAPYQRLLETFRTEPLDAARPADMNIRDGLAKEAGGHQIVDNGLNFRQFRQSIRLWWCFGEASSAGRDGLGEGNAFLFGLPASI